jgi:DNA invertase Pin-like site-specific DNA recombinase
VKLDRLTRSVKDLATLMDTFKRAKVGFTSIQESVDTASASGELFFNLVASVSQWERRAIGERTKSAMAHLRSNGRQVSRHLPYGYRLASDELHLRPDPHEQKSLAMIRRLAPNRSLRQLSRILAGRGVFARGGRPFAPSTLAGLLAVRGPLRTDKAASRRSTAASAAASS